MTKNYTVIYANDANVEFHLKNANFFLEATGLAFHVQADNETPCEYEILLGRVDREESRALYASSDAPDLMHYTVCVKGNKILIAGYDYFSTKQAILYVKEQLAGGVVINAIPARINEALLAPFPEKAASIRALHYNILVEYIGWGCGGLLDGPVQTRVEPICGIIRGYDPDVLCLCEVFERWAMCLPMWLADRYQFVCLNRADGYSNRTVLAFKKNALRLIECGYEDIPAVKTINKRVMVWALLEDRASGKRFIAVGTHWESTSDEDRQKQAVLMPELIQALRDRFCGTEVIAMGDFNGKMSAPSYKMFVEKSGMLDADGVDWSVDHIFVTDGIKVMGTNREVEHFATQASDHKAVRCDFEV